MKENKDLKFKVRAVPNANTVDEALIKEDFIKLTEADETVHDKRPEKKVHRANETVVILSEYIDEQQKLLDKYDDITMDLIKVIEKQSAMIDGYQKVIGLVLYNGNDERT